MSFNSFGRLFRVTTWGESHGPAIGCVLDGVPPRLTLDAGIIQPYLDKRRPGQSRFVTQRKESDSVAILSGTFEGQTTGTPIALEITRRDWSVRDESHPSGVVANHFHLDNLTALNGSQKLRISFEASDHIHLGQQATLRSLGDWSGTIR